MPMLKRLASDYNLWFLLAFNLYLIWYYGQHPQSFKTLACLYWVQSIIIGLFTFIGLLTDRMEPTEMIVNGVPKIVTGQGGCMAFFFLFHYGMFHLVYAVFLLAVIEGKLDFQLLMYGAGIIFLGAVSSFIRDRVGKKESTSNLGLSFFVPYLRIIPMHLMILAPTFFGLGRIGVFLWLKMFMDLIMYLLTSKRDAGTALTS
jgi:hypothetical protein